MNLIKLGDVKQNNSKNNETSLVIELIKFDELQINEQLSTMSKN